MAIKFPDEDTESFPGLHGRVTEQEPPLVNVQTDFFGVRGTSMIISGTSGRFLDIDYMLFDDFTTFLAINQKLRDIDNLLVGTSGTLRVTGVDADDNHQEYEDCVFLAFIRRPFAGQNDPVPIPDGAGTVDGGYHIRGILRFKQLTVP